MIDKSTYELDWLDQIAAPLGSRGDRKILEKVVYAFTLLEQLKAAGLEFIFKGGTSLLLLTSPPRRFSIDIDIVTAIQRDQLKPYLDAVVAMGVFTNWVDDNNRRSAADAPVGHYKFYYNSKVDARSGQEPILLDLLFAENPYPRLVELHLRHQWLQTSGDDLLIRVPVIECIAGDKLAAFAPTTTGILYEKDRPVEIIKQLYDVAFLIDHAGDFKLLRQSYIANVTEELKYRKLDLAWQDVLNDTVQTCRTITNRDGSQEHFRHLQRGIGNIVNFILERFKIEEATICAAKVAYLSRLILRDDQAFDRYQGPTTIAAMQIENPDYRHWNKLKKSNPEAFFYWHKFLKD